MWAERARSWRKNKKRAVSPIIATILLVAITVVLAAVLYILISGLTKGPGNTPLGTAFGWGPASNVTSATHATGCANSVPCYSLEIGSAGGGITTGGITFSLRTPAGGVLAFHTASPAATVKLVSVSGTPIATWTASASGANGGSWDNTTVALTAGDTFVLSVGVGVGLSGDTVLAVGMGSYSGTVQSAALN
ncbi:MAG: archaellin/type IV pilin N-terminal domain-containing protein [Thermoplasmata archaeon]